MSRLARALARGLRPKKKRTVAQWMEDEFRLSAESSRVQGPFRFGAASYQRGIAEAVGDPDVHEVVLMTSAQVGKTTVGRGVIGYFIDQEPSPILAVVPSDKVAVSFAADFIDPMIRDTPVLRRLFKSKDGRTQTAIKKSFPGGTLSIVGANVPSNLAMRPIRVVFGDEIDRWPKSSGKEGSPRMLATKRTKTFDAVKKLIWASTPLMKETSEINALWEQSDKRRFHVKCPDCDHEQYLKWDNVIYKKGQEAKAMYACDACGSLWSEMTKRRLVREGRWIASAPEARIVGFQLSELYSPWSSMEAMAVAWEEARGRPDLEQTFWNTSLGEPWDGATTARATAEQLAARREEIARGRLAMGVALLTAGVDIQRDRIELMVWGWGPGEEGWVVDHHVIHGDPAGPKIWNDVREWMARSYEHPLGFSLGIEAAAFDSGDGTHTQAVYDFCGQAQAIGYNWLAIKGTKDGPIWSRSKMKFSKNPLFKLYLVGTNNAKSNLYARYGTVKPGPAYVHIPTWLPDAILDQMTSEWAQTEWNDKGFPTITWNKQKGARNEALDMSCYAYAIMKHLDLDLAYRLLQWQTPAEESLTAEQVGALFA